MSYRDKKEQARELFVNSNMTQQSIAQMVSVTAKTLRKWIIDNGWKEEKDAESITRRSLLADAYKQLASVNKEINEKHNGVPDKKLSDVKGQLRREIEALSVKPLHRYIEVLHEVIDWGRIKGRAELGDFTEFMNDFIQDLAKDKNV